MKKQFYGGRGILIKENPVVKGLQYKQDISIDWTSEEQSIFEYTVEKYVSEISIIRYAHIAQALPNKSIRDVAFRSIWMRENKNKKRDDISGSKTFFGKSIVSDSCGRLIEHNAQILDQIDTKFYDLKNHEIINLLSKARGNIHTIVSDLPEKIHDRMPPFPFKINEELANSVLPPPKLRK
ncbi:hypothetical protein ACS0TY_025081 [Phlomoides rotata]